MNISRESCRTHELKQAEPQQLLNMFNCGAARVVRFVVSNWSFQAVLNNQELQHLADRI